MILIRFLLLIIFRENFNVNMLRDCGIVLDVENLCITLIIPIFDLFRL